MKTQNSGVQWWTTSGYLILTLVVIIIIWYLQFLWNNRKLFIFSRKFPGPFRISVIGILPYAIGNKNMVISVCDIFKRNPNIFCLWLGTTLCCCISDPKYVNILLKKCLDKASEYRFLGQDGNGLFTATNGEWKKRRTILQPWFNQKVFDGYVDTFSKKSEILAEKLEKFIGKREFDIFSMMSKCTVDMVCETIIGVEVNVQENEQYHMHNWIDGLFRNLYLRLFTIPYRSDFIFNFTRASKTFTTCITNLRQFCMEMINARKKIFEDTIRQETHSNQLYDEKGTKCTAIFDNLMKLTRDVNTNFTYEDVVEETSTFIVAGSHTTAASTLFILLMLGLHKDLQEKVYEEIIEVVGPNRPVDKYDLPKLQYLEMFIKETLRIFPVGGIIARVADRDVDIGDFVVPKGVILVFSLLALHMNPKYWPEPDKFDPNRFLPEIVATRPPGVYIPFLYGPRNCIGGKYAIMAMKVIIATVLRKFTVGTLYKDAKDVKFTNSMLLAPVDGHKLYLNKRI